MLRAARNRPASTSSFTALALAPGALNTGMPRAAQLGDRDVVDARAGAADGAHACRGSAMPCMSAERTRIASGRVEVGGDLVALARQALEAARR